MQLDTINTLYLELSQVATATTAKELALRAQLSAVDAVLWPTGNPPENYEADRATRLRAILKLREDGAGIIATERMRQISKEDYHGAHDDAHDRGQLLAAAISYAQVNLLRLTYRPENAEAEVTEMMASVWPWDEEWWKPSNDAVRNLAKAGALIAAEIDRLQRLANVAGEPQPPKN